MDNTVLEISVCLCTYKRPDMLADCLRSLLEQTFPLPFEVIIVDNDSHRSGEKIVHGFKDAFGRRGIPLSYLVEPVQNISLARNRCVQAARGNLVAFIDDDERASSHWLEILYNILKETNADGVWGPVIPDIPATFPAWMRNSKIFYRPSQKDKSIARAYSLRTGNALIKKNLLQLRNGPFNEDFGRTGGEDSDLFGWLQQQGAKFIWSEHASVFEKIDESRKYLRWHFRRAYRGGWGYSRFIVKNQGRRLGMLISFSRIIPSFLKALFKAVLNLNKPRYACVLLISNICTNIGKIGYFAGAKVEEYKG